MKRQSIIWGIILLFLLSSLIPMVSGFESQFSKSIYVDDETEYARINDNSSIKCSNNYYLFCNISVNGHVLYAENQIGIIGNELHILFFIDNRTDPHFEYGFVSIDGILRNHDFRYVLGVTLYGFNGNASWENIVEDADILVEGSAFLVRVSYHGDPL